MLPISGISMDFMRGSRGTALLRISMQSTSTTSSFKKKVSKTKKKKGQGCDIFCTPSIHFGFMEGTLAPNNHDHAFHCTAASVKQSCALRAQQPRNHHAAAASRYYGSSFSQCAAGRWTFRVCQQSQIGVAAAIVRELQYLSGADVDARVLLSVSSRWQEE